MKTITLIATLLLAPAAYADDVGKHDTTKTDAPVNGKAAKPAKLSKAELQVLAHYHAFNLMEIDLGKTAKRVGRSTGVKDYGTMLVAEHGADDKELIAFAKNRGQIIPAERPMDEVQTAEKAADKARAAKIKKLKGAEFDAAYLVMMIDGHEKELNKVDAMAAKCQDTELADMVRAKKSLLQRHADAARELQQNSNQASR